MANSKVSHIIQKNENNFAALLINYIDQKNDNGAVLLKYVDRYIAHVCRSYHHFSLAAQEDIRQEVAISLLCKGERYRHTFSKRLLYVIVRYECLDQIRKQNKQLSTFVSSVSEEEARSAPTPTMSDGADADLFQHLNCLENIFGEIASQPTGKEDMHIYTQYAFGLSYLEISHTANRSVAAVGRRISILKHRLHKLKNELC